MEVIARGADRQLLIQLRGELDHHGAKTVIHEISQAMDAALPLYTILDFQGVSFMDSSGIAVLLRTQRRMQALGGKLTVIHLSAQAQKVLCAAGLERYITVE